MSAVQELFADPRAPRRRYAQVVLERGIDRPGGLTYEVPPGWEDLRIGERVEAPLGRGKGKEKSAAGVVVAIADSPGAVSPSRIKPLSRRSGVRLPAPLLHLASWIASYYCCPIGMTLAAMVPAAVKHATGRVKSIELDRTGAEPRGPLPPATRRAWEALCALPAGSLPMRAKELAREVGASSVAPLNRLVEAGALKKVERVQVRAGWEGAPEVAPAPVFEPTPAQRAVIDAVSASLGSFHAHLIRGVTGSGKTEVYLRVIERMLAQGRCAIVLVPEISLTPQAIARYTGRFGAERVAVLHSGLTASQRHQQWARIEAGEAQVAIGARSAVFAPFGEGRLGLIVVDEEHDSAYKQEDLPRYHARDVAIKRAQQEGCPVALGSATPSLESWRNAQRGKASLHELRQRVGGALLPKVEVVDLDQEMRLVDDRALRDAMLGPTLCAALGRALAEGGQAILLINRRGFAGVVRCGDHRCAWSQQCERCDASMVVHRSRDLPVGGLVRCHHCEAEQRVPRKCPVCGKGVVALGAGSQRVEQELPRLFPELIEGESLLRMDGDTMRSAKHYFDALDRFGRGEVRVLVGTQVLGKGLDFPNVSLVGVVNADTALALPDFRSAERTFQLVSQVAGRSGRSAGRPGRVIVQTLHPGQPAIRFAATHDFVGFAEQELRVRERAGLPPHTRMARVVVRDTDLGKARQRASEIAALLRRTAERETTLRVVGPAACAIARVNERHRVGVELFAPTAAPIQRALAEARGGALVKSDARTAVDVDPVSVM